jgi:DNA-binding MltR family transcriptional regulator
MVDSENLNKIVDSRINKIKALLNQKGSEYATKDDKLHNFKVVANINKVTPKQALWGMASKHLYSVMKIVSEKNSSISVADEKIGDLINYLILLEALVQEQHDNSWKNISKCTGRCSNG